MAELPLSAASTAMVGSGSSDSSPLTGLDKETQPAPRRKKPFFRGAPSQAWRDLRSAKWGKFGLWFLYIIWLTIVVLALANLGWIANKRSNLGFSACQPDGSFSPFGDKFNWWGSSAFFQISLAHGEYTFTNVKILDIAFQLVVGRGGQALLAFLSWKAFRNFFTVKMTNDPITFATFFVVFLQPEPTLVSTYRLIREFSLHRRPGSIATAIFIPITIIFTLVFPTAVNSMTGYMTVNNPYIEDRDQKMLPYDDFDRVAYIIHDGERINETDDLIIPFYARSPVIADSMWYNYKCNSGPDEEMDEPEGCDLLRAASSYTEEYGFFGLTDQETTWMGDVELDAPALNVSGVYFSPAEEYYGRDWKDPRDGGSYPFTSIESSQYVSGGELYDMPYMLEHGKCQPSSETYKWGVSFAQFFIMLIALFIWSVGTSIMWFKGHRRLPLANQPEVPNGWRAVVELARAMEAEFRAASVDITALTDAKVKREVRKKLRGGSVSFREHRLSRREGDLGPAVWAWLKREKWWVLWSVGPLAVAFGLYFGFVPLAGIIAPVLWSIGGSTTMALWLGTTLGSRVFILTVLLVAASLPIIILAGLLHGPHM